MGSRQQFFALGLLPAAAAVLTACGGSSSATGSSTAPSLAGTAAVGAPLSQAAVTLRDANGKELRATADDNGAYTFADVSALVAPLMLKVTGTAGGNVYTLYSVAPTVATDKGASGVVNVNAGTDSVVTQALGAGTPEAVFQDAAQIKALDTTRLDEAKGKVMAALKEVLVALNLDPAKVDLFTTPFQANNTGLDKLLDLVQIQSEGTNIRIADKNTGKAVTIQANTQEAVAALPPPDAKLVALDTSTIKNLLASFNALTGSQADITSDAMKNLFDADFLQEGLDRAAMLAQFWTSASDNFVGGKLQSYVVGACDGSTQVCEGSMTVQEPDGSTNQFSLPVRLGTDGKWHFYGDRSAFQFDLKPVVQAYYRVSNGVKTLNGSVMTGINLWIPTSGGLQKATLYGSNDDGKTWTESLRLVVKPTCGNDFLAVDDGTTDNCGNFKPVSDANAIAANGYVDQGTRKFKIVGLTASGASKTFEARSRRHLFTAVTGQAALDRTPMGIALDQLGSNSVAFTGYPHDVSAHIVSGSNQGGLGWSSAALAKLGGTVTVAAANAQCRLQGMTTTQCDSTFNTSTGKIVHIDLNGRDAAGRGVWLHYDQGSN